MKKLFLNYKVSTKGAMIVPGVFKIAGAPAGAQNAVVILNNTPNNQISDAGGWNFLYTDTEDSDTLKVSKRLNPLYNAGEVPAPRPEVPQYVPANFRTIKEALVALDNGEAIQDA